jgi:hypothetical protein
MVAVALVLCSASQQHLVTLVTQRELLTQRDGAGSSHCGVAGSKACDQYDGRPFNAGVRSDGRQWLMVGVRRRHPMCLWLMVCTFRVCKRQAFCVPCLGVAPAGLGALCGGQLVAVQAAGHSRCHQEA